jgi:hypothetical protein
MSNCLDNLGAFSLSRWKHISEIHVLFPGDAGHIYVAKRADLPHYQEVFAKFALALEAYEDCMPVYLYLRGDDYMNHFLTVYNSTTSVKAFVNRVDWMEVHRIACRPKKKQGKGQLEKKRQARFEDTGYCSLINQTRDGTTNGIAEPRMKAELTHDPVVVNGYVVLSKLIRSADTKWSRSNKKLFSDRR